MQLIQIEQLWESSLRALFVLKGGNGGNPIFLSIFWGVLPLRAAVAAIMMSRGRTMMPVSTEMIPLWVDSGKKVGKVSELCKPRQPRQEGDCEDRRTRVRGAGYLYDGPSTSLLHDRSVDILLI